MKREALYHPQSETTWSTVYFRNNVFAAAIAITACTEPPTGKVPECASCAVELEDPLVLHGPSEAEASLSARVRRDQQGRFFVAPLIDAFKIALFAPDGRFIRALGRRGSGPGEFMEIMDFQIGLGDTLYVLHDASISVFAPTTFELVRSSTSRQARMARHLALLSDGSAVTGRTSTMAGAPPEDLVWIHRPESDPVAGGLVGLDSASSALFVRNDSMWLLRSDYKLLRKAPSQSWSVVTERPLWFAEDGRLAPREDRRPPHVNDLVIADDGRLWILAYTFTGVEAPPRRAGGEERARQLSTSEFRSYAHPRLDGWNLDGSLFLSVPLEDGIIGFADQNHVVQVADDSAGNVIIGVRRFRVKSN